MQVNNNGVVSIITIVYNRVFDIEKTMKSVYQQSYPYIQHVIIDGGSTDGTLDIIKKYLSDKAIFISEKDKGIYDAMNKGLQLATGEYILFINGGDSLFANDTIDKVMAQNNNFDILYGDCLFVDASDNEVGLRSKIYKRDLPSLLNKASFRFGSNISHQSFMAKRAICPPFDLSFRIAADMDWMLKVITQSKNNKNTNCIISRYLVGGTSNQHQWKSFKERFTIFYKNYGPITLVDHLIIFLKKIFF